MHKTQKCCYFHFKDIELKQGRQNLLSKVTEVSLAYWIKEWPGTCLAPECHGLHHHPVRWSLAQFWSEPANTPPKLFLSTLWALTRVRDSKEFYYEVLLWTESELKGVDVGGSRPAGLVDRKWAPAAFGFPSTATKERRRAEDLNRCNSLHIWNMQLYSFSSLKSTPLTKN